MGTYVQHSTWSNYSCKAKVPKSRGVPPTARTALCGFFFFLIEQITHFGIFISVIIIINSFRYRCIGSAGFMQF